MGGSRRESFGGLRESLGRVFEVATPHLREADRDHYARIPTDLSNICNDAVLGGIIIGQLVGVHKFWGP